MGRRVVTLILLLALGSGGAAASAWGLNRGGRAAQGGAIVGGVALLGIVALAFALDAPRVGSGSIPAGVGLLDGRLIPNDYLRFAIALWALDAVLVVFVAWLAGGLAALRGLLPALLASIVGGAVALAATNLTIGAAAAGATGFVALVVLLAWRDPASASRRRPRAAGDDPLDGARARGDHPGAAGGGSCDPRGAGRRRAATAQGARWPAPPILPAPLPESGCSSWRSPSRSPCARASSRSTCACRGSATWRRRSRCRSCSPGCRCRSRSSGSRSWTCCSRRSPCRSAASSSSSSRSRS